MERDGTVPHLEAILVFGWVYGMERTSSSEANIPLIRGTESFDRIGRTWENASLITAPNEKKKRKKASLIPPAPALWL